MQMTKGIDILNCYAIQCGIQQYDKLKGIKHEQEQG